MYLISKSDVRSSRFCVARYGVPEPYEKLKAFTRGQRVTQQSMQEFVENIDGLPEAGKKALRNLTPMTYIGNAASQAKNLNKYL